MIAELQTAISNVPNRKARMKGLTQVEAVKIKVERAALLFRGAPVAIGMSAMNAAITAAVAWSDIDRTICSVGRGRCYCLPVFARLFGCGFAWAGHRAAICRVSRAFMFSRWRLTAPCGARWGRFLPFTVLSITHFFLLLSRGQLRAPLFLRAPPGAPRLRSTYQRCCRWRWFMRLLLEQTAWRSRALLRSMQWQWRFWH